MTAPTQARAGAPPTHDEDRPGATNTGTAETSTRALTHREVTPSLPQPAPSIESPQAARRGRQDFWLGWKTGNRHGTTDAYNTGHADGYRVGWVDRDRASLDDAAQQWAGLGKAVTAHPSEAELQRRRSLEACHAYRIAVRDPASRNDVHNRADLYRVCAESWGDDW